MKIGAIALLAMSCLGAGNGLGLVPVGQIVPELSRNVPANPKLFNSLQWFLRIFPTNGPLGKRRPASTFERQEIGRP